jgi:DNA ligase 1
VKKHYDRRPRTGIMLAYPFDEKRLAKWGPFCIAQKKLNGLRCKALRTSDHVELLSSTGLPITTVPHVEAEMMNLPPGLYDGELYLHEEFQRLTSLVMRNEIAPEYRDVQYHIFDMCSSTQQVARLIKFAAYSVLVNPEIIQIVPSYTCGSVEEIEKVLQDAMAAGYEGLILRDPNAPYVEKRTTAMMKLKPRSSDTYRIVGFLEEHSIHNEPKGTLGAFQVVDADGRSFKVGSGFTAAQRRDFWQQRDALLGHICYVKYQALTDRGVPWFPVFIEVLR